MRTEAEVRRMLEDIRRIDREHIKAHNGRSLEAATVAIAILVNVLDGPSEGRPCGCMGPLGFCRCEIYALGMDDPEQSR